MEKACKNYMEARRGGETDQQNAITHKGGVTRSNFSRNGVALKVDETCCTSQLSQNSSFCAKSFWNHFKNSQRVAELNIARKSEAVACYTALNF